MTDKEINNGKEPKYKYVYTVCCSIYDKEFKRTYCRVEGVYSSYKDAKMKMYDTYSSLLRHDYYYNAKGEVYSTFGDIESDMHIYKIDIDRKRLK